MSTPSVLEAKTLSKWFGEVVAVNNLTLSVAAGVTGLLGANGAGKSTFIKLALGLYAPSRGEIRLFGEHPRNNLRVLSRIGYCPESDKFFEGMTGYELVYWSNRFSGNPHAEARKRALDALETMRMTARMNDPITEYSRGMRQRVKIAQSIAQEADLLFLDEPMAGLDPSGREEVFALIRSYAETGRTVVFSSHILYEIERVTNNVVLLHHGCVLARGQVRQIRELIDEHPHAVTVSCDRPRVLAEVFVKDEGTLNIEFVDGGVTVRTRTPNLFYQKLNDLALDRSIAINRIHCPDDNLQSVFSYLME